MSKITFRADDELIDRLEAFDASKSEVMREALREYLGDASPSASDPPSSASESVTDAETIDELIEERVDSIIADRLQTRHHHPQPQDVNVNISLDGVSAGAATPKPNNGAPLTGVQAPRTGGLTVNAMRPTRAGDDRAGNGNPTQRHEDMRAEEIAALDLVCPNCGAEGIPSGVP